MSNNPVVEVPEAVVAVETWKACPVDGTRFFIRTNTYPLGRPEGSRFCSGACAAVARSARQGERLPYTRTPGWMADKVSEESAHLGVHQFHIEGAVAEADVLVTVQPIWPEIATWTPEGGGSEGTSSVNAVKAGD